MDIFCDAHRFYLVAAVVIVVFLISFLSRISDPVQELSTLISFLIKTLNVRLPILLNIRYYFSKSCRNIKLKNFAF